MAPVASRGGLFVVPDEELLGRGPAECGTLTGHHRARKGAGGHGHSSLRKSNTQRRVGGACAGILSSGAG